MSARAELRGRTWPLPPWLAPRHYDFLNADGGMRLIYAHIRLAEVEWDGADDELTDGAFLAIGGSDMIGAGAAAVCSIVGVERTELGGLQPLTAAYADYSAGAGAAPTSGLRVQGWPASLYLRAMLSFSTEPEQPVSVTWWVSPDGLAWTFAAATTIEFSAIMRVGFFLTGIGVGLLDWVRAYELPPFPWNVSNQHIIQPMPPTGGRIFTP